MCGLFAGTGKLTATRITALGSMNESRGTDSVGLAWRVSEKEVKVHKVAERPAAALNLTLRKEVLEAAMSGLFIGHTRQATQGKVCAENAHPFVDGDIVFAHNGIITNDEKFGKYDVDSQALIHGIRKRDFSEYEGSIALVWIENNTLHAFRHDNPLWRGRIGDTVYLASEQEQLEAIGCEHVKELAENQVYTFQPGQVPKVQKVAVNISPVWSSYQDYAAWSKTPTGLWVKDHTPIYDVDSDRTWKDERDERLRLNTTETCGRCGCADLMEDWCLNCGYHPNGQQADEETLKTARIIHGI